jgi:protein-export membrane protein SecD/preprotein translocase SecF subunit
VSWIRITKWKVAAIFVVVLAAIVIDGWSYVARVTSTRTSTVVASSQDTTTSFAVTSGTGAAFAAGQSVTVGGQQSSIESVKGDVITLYTALKLAPSAGTQVEQHPGLAGLTHELTAAPSILGAKVYLRKGLDIQGGSELTIAICKGYNNPPGIDCRNAPGNGVSIAQAQQQTIPVLQQRVNGLGVSEATVQGEGDDLIIVQLPGVSLAEAETTIGTTAQLHFATAVAGAPPAGALTDPNYCGKNPGDSFCRDQQNLYEPSQLTSATDYLIDPTTGAKYHWKIDTKIPASEIASSAVGTAGTTGAPVVDITFNSSGGNEWNSITNTAYAAYQSSGCTQNSGCVPASYIAIFLDKEIISVPVVTGGDQGNKTEISGLTLAEAQRLNSQISAGALPAEIGTEAATTVSPTLGAKTVNATLLAGAVGLIIVILFMIGYYRFPGLLASAALILYSLINLAAYKLIGVTVSLAGLAGFVLSVGMAVDANVLIFERTRDELRHGRPVGIAVETGFRRAFPAIRDSNISTEIVCFILYFFGFDVVKGFALTLGIGVAISFFSAVLITQSMLAWVLRWKIGRNPTLYTEIHREYEQNPPKGRFDIVKRRNIFFAASLAIIIPGLLAMLFWHDPTSPEGFRLGIDFAGGDQIQATFIQPTTTAELISAVNSVRSGLEPQVQNNGSNAFSIQTLPVPYATLEAVYNKVDNEYHVKPGTENVQAVGASIASSLVVSAIILILISALCIAMYLAYQFGKQRQVNRWRFAACTFFKLLHDVFVLAGIWAIIGHFTALGQVDSYFVTALLTAVAFSIHDTIVVFDRIRENLRVGPRFTFDQTVNLSTVQTMTRSLNTSLTVIFVLLALVLFGGSTIQGFVLALLVGIVTGTYSSIFNASTLLVSWEKARPQQIPGHGTRKVAARPARAT